MPSSKRPCKNHPDKLTTRKCFHCGQPVCKDCQLKRDKHIFCGPWHYFIWKLGQWRSQIELTPQLVTVIGLLILSNLILIFYIHFKFNSLQGLTHSIPTDRSATATATATFLDTLRMPLNHVLLIKLQVEKGRVATLWRDGKFIESEAQGEAALEFSGQILHHGQNQFALWTHGADGQSALIDSFTINFRSLRNDYLRQAITEFPITKKQLALTFDGGSLDRGASQIIETLRAAGVRCTIFLTGEFIQKYPELVKQMTQDGHEIGNHSFSHPHLTNLEIDGSNRTLANVDRAYIHRQLRAADSIFQAIIGKHMIPFWRAPYGEINDDILLWAAEAGYRHIGWSSGADTRDWVADANSKLYRNGRQIIESILELDDDDGLNGKILLMHLGTERNNGDEPYLILPELLQSLKSRGYDFRKVSEVMTESIKIRAHAASDKGSR